MALIRNAALTKEYYNSLVEKNEDYKTTFVAAVKTTGIYCLSVCYARKPKFENVDFYTSIEDAEGAGYRACKLCKPKATLRLLETKQVDKS